MPIRLKRRAARLVCGPALLGVILGLVPGAAVAAEAPEGTPLVPELATLAEPAVAAAPEAAQAEAMALPAEGPGSIVREGGDVVVEAHFESGALTRTGALEAAGATVLAVSARYQTVALAVAPEDLEALAEVQGLERVKPSLKPVLYEAEEPSLAATTSVTSNGLCEGGAVISQAMTQLRVAAARGVFGARGAGQTIGVISNSFNTATEAIGGGALATHASQDEVSNDLPGPESTCSGQQVPVRVLAEGPANSTDEGRAMLQVIHDLAPHAELAFASGEPTELQFAQNIERLAAPVVAGGAGADVIVDDLGYYEEPFFQDGPVAVAIKRVTEAGVIYLTAAGNDNLIHNGNDFASWERSEFQDTACPIKIAPLVGKASSEACLNFSPSGTDATFGIAVEPKSTLIVDLQWAEPWYGVESDLDAYLLDSTGKILVSEPGDNVAGTAAENGGEPVELFGWENKSTSTAIVQLVIDRCTHSCNPAANQTTKPRLKFALLENGSGVSATEYPESDEEQGIVVGPTIYGHAGSAAAITLAAANFQESPTAPITPERYSSRGPVTHYFGPVLNSTEPAAELASPEELQKPNVAATDCAVTTFFAGFVAGVGWEFCGTSEAAPHAAAVAALMRQTQPAATPSSVLTALESSATPFTVLKKRSAGGAGLVNAEAAIAAIGGAPVNDPASSVVGTVQRNAPVGEVTATPAGEQGSAGKKTKSKPKAKIVAHPKPVERTRKSSIVGRFRFAANEKGVTFSCQVDRAAQRTCGARFKRRFGIGRHVVKVRAITSSDHTSSEPVAFRFQVKRLGH